MKKFRRTKRRFFEERSKSCNSLVLLCYSCCSFVLHGKKMNTGPCDIDIYLDDANKLLLRKCLYCSVCPLSSPPYTSFTSFLGRYATHVQRMQIFKVNTLEVIRDAQCTRIQNKSELFQFSMQDMEA